MDIILKGVAFGFVLAITVGPVFFKLLQISIRKGWAHGLFFVLGITITDIFYAFGAYLGFSALLELETVQFYLALIGGVILILYGFMTLFAAQKVPESGSIGKQTYLAEMISGIVINGLNPFVLLFWVGIISITSIEFEMDSDSTAWFLGVILLTNLCFDVTKVFVANRIRRHISHKRWRAISKFVGVALMLFGLRLIYFAVSI